MAKAIASGHSAVMAQKRPRISDGTPWQKFELFPTPPFATRALFENIFPVLGVPLPTRVHEPCAGLRHMADVIAEYVPNVVASDAFLYDPRLDVVQLDFVRDPWPDDLGAPEWFITNPPFSGDAKDGVPSAVDVFERADALLGDNRDGGIALLLRTNWLESEDRYERIFAENPPTLFAPFAERVAMCEGGYDPALSTATSYAWFVWVYRAGEAVQLEYCGFDGKRRFDFFPTFVIPPGRKAELTRPSDRLLAARHVPGWIAPSTLKKTGKDQIALDFAVPIAGAPA